MERRMICECGGGWIERSRHSFSHTIVQIFQSRLACELRRLSHDHSLMADLPTFLSLCFFDFGCSTSLSKIAESSGCPAWAAGSCTLTMACGSGMSGAATSMASPSLASGRLEEGCGGLTMAGRASCRAGRGWMGASQELCHVGVWIRLPSPCY